MLSTTLRVGGLARRECGPKHRGDPAAKQQPGKDIYAVGGARLVSSLMNEDLVDELRLLVHPVVLGGGKALLKDVADRR